MAVKRLQSQTERDLEGLAARKERTASPPVGTPEVVSDDETSQSYDVPEERRSFRSEREPEKRFERLEEFKDEALQKFAELATELSKTNVAVAQTNTSIAEVRGAQGTTNALLGEVRDRLNEQRKKEMLHVEADIDINKHRKIELIKIAGAWREWVTKGLAIVSTGAAIVLALIQAGKC